MSNQYVKLISEKLSFVKDVLIKAGIKSSPEEFIKKKLIDSLIITLTLTTTLLFILIKTQKNLLFILLAFPLIYLLVFFFFINAPRSASSKTSREVDLEITYAGRFLLIELSAGTPLFDAIKNVSEHFEYVGKYFKEIIQKVEVGMSLEQALTETMELTPSDNFRKVLFTLSNSLKTGADISQSLQGIIEQISREKLIRLKEYGKKLNPVVMFYLIIAVIMPSLGIAVTTLLSSFLGISLPLATLVGISILIALIQFTFITIVDSLRRGI